MDSVQMIARLLSLQDQASDFQCTKRPGSVSGDQTGDLARFDPPLRITFGESVISHVLLLRNPNPLTKPWGDGPVVVQCHNHANELHHPLRCRSHIFEQGGLGNSEAEQQQSSTLLTQHIAPSSPVCGGPHSVHS